MSQPTNYPPDSTQRILSSEENNNAHRERRLYGTQRGLFHLRSSSALSVPEIVQHITMYLSTNDKKNASLVCVLWNEAVAWSKSERISRMFHGIRTEDLHLVEKSVSWVSLHLQAGLLGLASAAIHYEFRTGERVDQAFSFRLFETLLPILDSSESLRKLLPSFFRLVIINDNVELVKYLAISGYAELTAQISRNDIAEFEDFLRTSQVDVNKHREGHYQESTTPLYIAVEHQCPNVLKYLLPCVEYQGDLLFHAILRHFLMAEQEASAKLVSILLKDPRIIPKSKHITDAIMYWRNGTTIVKVLLDDGRVKPNAEIFLQAAASHTDVLQVVLKQFTPVSKEIIKEAIYSAATNPGSLLLLLPLAGNFLEELDLEELSDACTNENMDGEIEYLEEVILMLEVVRRMKDRSGDTPDEMWTLLKLGCKQGYKCLVELILREGFDLAEKDSKEEALCVVLPMAAFMGHSEIVKILLTDNITVIDDSAIKNTIAGAVCVLHEEPNYYGRLLGSPRDYSEILTCLLDDSRSEIDGGWAIMEACKNGLEAMASILLDKGIDPGCNDNEALRYAAREGHVGVVKLLLDSGKVDPSAKNHEPIRTAAFLGHHKIVEMLSVCGNVPRAAILAAEAGGHNEIVELLQSLF